MPPGLFSSYIKNQKYLDANLFTLFYFVFYLSIYIYKIWSLQITVEGVTTPCSRWVQVFVILCAGAVNEVLRGSPIGLITLVLN